MASFSSKNRMCFRITALILVQAFLTWDLCWAAGAFNLKVNSDTLSPSINISRDNLQAAFLQKVKIVEDEDLQVVEGASQEKKHKMANALLPPSGNPSLGKNAVAGNEAGSLESADLLYPPPPPSQESNFTSLNIPTGSLVPLSSDENDKNKDTVADNPILNISIPNAPENVEYIDLQKSDRRLNMATASELGLPPETNKLIRTIREITKGYCDEKFWPDGFKKIVLVKTEPDDTGVLFLDEKDNTILGVMIPAIPHLIRLMETAPSLFKELIEDLLVHEGGVYGHGMKWPLTPEDFTWKNLIQTENMIFEATIKRSWPTFVYERGIPPFNLWGMAGNIIWDSLKLKGYDPTASGPWGIRWTETQANLGMIYEKGKRSVALWTWFSRHFRPLKIKIADVETELSEYFSYLSRFGITNKDIFDEVENIKKEYENIIKKDTQPVNPLIKNSLLSISTFLLSLFFYPLSSYSATNNINIGDNISFTCAVIILGGLLFYRLVVNLVRIYKSLPRRAVNLAKAGDIHKLIKFYRQSKLDNRITIVKLLSKYNLSLAQEIFIMALRTNPERIFKEILKLYNTSGIFSKKKRMENITETLIKLCQRYGVEIKGLDDIAKEIDYIYLEFSSEQVFKPTELRIKEAFYNNPILRKKVLEVCEKKIIELQLAGVQAIKAMVKSGLRNDRLEKIIREQRKDKNPYIASEMSKILTYFEPHQRNLINAYLNKNETENIEEAIKTAERKGLINKLFHRNLKWPLGAGEFESKRKPKMTYNLERLGWLDILSWVRKEEIDKKLLELTAEIKNEGFKKAVNIGIGGSANGAQALKELYKKENFEVLGSVEPEEIRRLEEKIDLAKTIFFVISKSWTTVETAELKNYFYNKLYRFYRKEYPKKEKEEIRGMAGRHFIIISDPWTQVIAEAKANYYREVIDHDENTGGRFASIFDVVGLLPAAWMGIIEPLVNSGAQMMEFCRQEQIVDEQGVIINPGAYLGILMAGLEKMNKTHATFILPSRLKGYYTLIAQLVAESLGKKDPWGNQHGVIPILADEFNPEYYKKDRNYFIYLRLDGEADFYDEKIKRLKESGFSVIEINLKDVDTALGSIPAIFNTAIAIAGYEMGVNFADEPGVWITKDIVLKGFIPLFEKMLNQGKVNNIQEFLEHIKQKISTNFVVRSSQGIELDYGYTIKRVGREKFSQTLRKITFIKSVSFKEAASDLTYLYAACLILAAENRQYADLLIYGSKDRFMETAKRWNEEVQMIQLDSSIGWEPEAQHWKHQEIQDGPRTGFLTFVGIRNYGEKDIPVSDKAYTFGQLTSMQRLSNILVQLAGVGGLGKILFDIRDEEGGKKFIKKIKQQKLEEAEPQWGVSFTLENSSPEDISQLAVIFKEATILARIARKMSFREKQNIKRMILPGNKLTPYTSPDNKIERKRTIESCCVIRKKRNLHSEDVQGLNECLIEEGELLILIERSI